MDPSRYIRNPYEDFRPEFASKIASELAQLKSVLESKSFFLPYLNQINNAYPYNDVYVGKYGILLFYFFLQKKYPHFRQNLLSFYASCIAKCDKKCHSVISFHCGQAGIVAIESVVQHLIFKDLKKRDENLSKLAACVENAINPQIKNFDELLYGRVSLLYALCFVENELRGSVSMQELAHVIRIDECKRSLVATILHSGAQGRAQERDPLLSYHYSWHGKAYCGAAHGYAGIYYLVLKNRHNCTPDQLNDLIASSMRLVQTQLLSSGNMTSKLNGRWSQRSSAVLFSSIQQIADTCLNTTWQFGILSKGLNLCHGSAGNAYAFLAWYRQTGDQKSLYRAIQFAKYCLNFGEQFMLSDRPLSLYEGLAGTIYFLVDITSDPNETRFPAFEL